MNGIRPIFLLAICLISVLHCSAQRCRHISELGACKYCCNPNNYSFIYEPQVIEGQCACSKEDEKAIYESLRGGDHGENWDSARPRPGECLHHLDDDQCVACCRPPVGVALNFFPGVYGISNKKCLCTTTDMELYGEPEKPGSHLRSSLLSDEEISKILKQLEEAETLKREKAEADERAKIEANKPRIKKVKFNGALETLPEGNESDGASEGVVLPPKPRKPDRRDILVGLSSIMTVLEKLEDSYIKRFTDLSEKELVEANSQYQKLTENKKNALRSMPWPRLVIDFAIAPMQLENPPALSSIKEQYRMFRRCHVMGMIHKEGERKEIMNNSLVWALFRKITSIPHGMVEYSEFEAAKNESLAKLERMNELTEKSLIYENLKELAELTYYFNSNLLKPFYIHIFPAMNTVQDVEVLELMYYEYIPLYGWRFNITGGYDEFTNTDSKEPGFMHVV